MIPDVTVHGVWVRHQVHDGFGRLCWKVIDRTYYGDVEFFVLWEPDEDLGLKKRTGSYANAEDLEVRPYKPRPWVENPPAEVKYKQWAEEHKAKKRKENDGDGQL